MKKLYIYALLSFNVLGAMNRMPIAEQYSYYKEAKQLLKDKKLDEVREHIAILRNLSNSKVRPDSLEALEEGLLAAQQELVVAVEQEQLLQQYNELEKNIADFHRAERVEQERDALEQLYALAKRLNEKPASLMAHDVRLFQMAEFGIGGARNTDLVIHLLDDVKQGDSEYAKRAIELMFYGKDDRRFSDPWEIMLNELKGQICDNPDQFEQFYELIRLNGSAELVRKLNNIVRGCALVEMPVGGAQREEGSEYDYEYLSSEEEPEAENIATESDMGVAQRLAREEEEELAVRLMQEEEDRRLAEQFEREEMGAFVVPVASRSDESADRQMAEALEERLRQEELDRQIAEALERGDDISDLF